MKFREIRARLEGKAFKSWLGIAGLWGVGLLPCPECGAPMLFHFWPLALAFTLTKLRRDKETAAEPVNVSDAHTRDADDPSPKM